MTKVKFTATLTVQTDFECDLGYYKLPPGVTPEEVIEEVIKTEVDNLTRFGDDYFDLKKDLRVERTIDNFQFVD
jgi:hypothetical protein